MLDPTIFSISGTLPPGLTFDPATGTISGTYTGDQQLTIVRADVAQLPAGLAAGALNVVGNVQLFATHSQGTGTTQLLFLLPRPLQAGNISTRMKVGLVDDVLIGGFIVTGAAPKKVIVRAVGPSLTPFGVQGALQDPTIAWVEGTISQSAATITGAARRRRRSSQEALHRGTSGRRR